MHVLQAKHKITENWTFKILFVSQRFFSKHFFFKFRYCIFKIAIQKWKKNYKFRNLRGLSTESFLAIWLSQYKFIILKKCV